MSVFDEVASNVKENEKTKNSKFIKNQKTMNMLTMILCLVMLAADTIYVIKESSVGIILFTKIILDIAIIAEIITTIILAFSKFNTENKAVKIMTAVSFSISVIGYIAMFKYADIYSILLFIFRIPLSAILIYIAVKEMLVSLKSFIIRWTIGGTVSVLVLITSLVLLFSVNERRTIYHNAELVDILDGTAKINIKDGTKSIGEKALKNAGSEVILPSSVTSINKDAFVDSNVTTLYISSSSISMCEALKNSNVKYIYINNSKVININDLRTANLDEDLHIVVHRDLVNLYRREYSEEDYLFEPLLDDNEIYIAFNGTILPVIILTKDQLPKEVFNPYSSSQISKIENDIKYVLTNWKVNREIISYPYSIVDSTEFDAKWERVYTINFDYDGGTPVDGSQIIASQEFYSSLPNKNLPILEKEGYDFTGWYVLDSSGDLTNNLIEVIDTSNLHDMSIKARFVKNYELTYHLNGGTMNGDETIQFNEDETIIVPPTPTREGYIFEGWYDNESFSGSKIAIVSTDHKDDIELYAKWSLINPIISLSNNVNKTFDNQYSELKATASHILADNIVYAYAWYKNGSEEVLSTTSSLNVRNVNESGSYYCVITAVDKNSGETATVTSNTISVNIKKADYELSTIYNTYELEYNGSYQLPNIGNIPAGLDGSVLVVTYTNASIKDAGTYANVLISFSSDSLNYNIPASKNIIVIVKEKVLTIEWPEELVFTYNGTALAPYPTITGLIGEDVCTYTYSDISKNIGVGQYSMEVTGLSNNNYLLPDNKSVNYQIIKAIETLNNVTVSDSLNNIYNGTAYYPKIEGSLPAGVKAQYSINPVEVGEYSVTVTFTYDSDNYEINDSYTKIVTILPKTVTIINNSILTYNGKKQAPTLSVQGLINDDICTATINGNINAGEYTEAVTLSNDNYILSNNSFTYTINKATYDMSSILFENQQVTYDGKPHGLLVKGTLPTGLDDVQITVSYSDISNNINVGQYSVIATFTGSNNYEAIDSMTAMITIIPKTVTVVFDDSVLIYNGENQAPSSTISGLVDGDICNAIIDKNTEAGTYSTSTNTLTVELDNDNYVLRSTDTYSYTINKANYDLSGIVYEGLNTTYNGNAQYITISGLPTGKDGYELTANYYIDDVLGAGKTLAGHYSVIIKFTVLSPNYNDVDNIEKTLIIGQKELKVTWDSVAFEYDGTVKAPKASISGYVNDDVITFGYSDTSNNINVGTYTISIINLSNSNYKLPSNASITYSIVQGVMELEGIEVYDLNVVYDGNVHYPTIVGTLPDDVVAIYSVDPINAGEYTVTVTFESSSSDYGISKVLSAVVTIAPKTITITNTSILTYNGNEQSPTIKVDGLVNNDQCIVTVLGHTDAGEYTENLIISNSNYAATSDTLKYTINKATYSYSLSFEDEVVTYDGTLHGIKVAGTLPTGLDDVQVSVSYSSLGIKNVGSLVITATFTGTSNYEEIPQMTATITVIAKTVSLTYSNTDLTYNGSQQSPTIAISGLVDGDICIATIKANTDAGEYEEDIILTNNNYTVANNKYTYTIKKADYDLSTITYSGLLAEYTGSSLGITIDGLPVGLDNYKLTANYYIDGIANATVINAGTYEVIVKFSSNSINYNAISDETITMIVEAKEIQITFNDDLVYTGSALAPTVKTITGLIGSDTVNVTVTEKVNAGTYSTTDGDIIVSIDNSNYKLEDGFEYSYTISPKRVSIVWGNTTFTYDGSSHIPTASIDNSALILEVTSNVEAINVGTYTATASITDTNYDVESDKTIEFSIVKATFENNKTVLDVVVTYDGKEHTPLVTGSSQYIDGEVVNWAFNKKPVNVGTYNVTVTFHVSNNYEDIIVQSTVTITALELELEFDTKEFTFNNNIQKPSIISSNIISGDDVELIVNNSSVDAGDYTLNIIISGSSANNYLLPSTNLNYIINKASYDMSNISYSNTIVTYNGTAQSPIINGLPTGVDNIQLTATIGSLTDVTTGKEVTVVFETTSVNYNTPTSTTVLMIINPAKLEVSGDSFLVAYNGSEVAPVITLLGVFGSDDVTVNIINKNSQVGEYSLTEDDVVLIGADSNNYVLESFMVNYEITKGNYDSTGLIFANTSVVYNGEAQGIIVSGSLSNAGADGTIPDLNNISYSGYGINVGTYTIVATIPSNSDNYNDLVLTATLTINQAQLDATFYIDSNIITNATTTVQYTGNSHQVQAIADSDDLYNDDIVNLGVLITYDGAEVSSIKKAGTYIITAHVIDNSNYEASDISYTITINHEYIWWLSFYKDHLAYSILNGVVTPDDIANGNNEDFYYIYSVTSTGEILNGYPTEAGNYTVTLHYDPDSVSLGSGAKNYNEFTLTVVSGSTTTDFSSDWALTGTNSETSTSGTVHVDNSIIAISNSAYTNLTSVSLSYMVEDKGSTLLRVYTSTDGLNWTQEGTDITPTRNNTTLSAKVSISNNQGAVYVKIEVICTKSSTNGKTASISSATLDCDVLKVS